MAVDKLADKKISDIFQKELGRAPTPAELAYFLKQSEGYQGEGALSPYEMQQYVASTPEAQEQQLGRYTGLYGQQLGASDQYVMGQAQNQLMGQFRQMGRAGSTGYISAFANAAQNLAAQRQQQIAQFYGGGLQDVMSNTQQTGQLALGRAQSLQDTQKQFERERLLNLENYYRQQNDYQNMLNQANRKQKTQALFGLGGMALGRMIGGVAGARIGATTGGFAGAAFS